MKYLFLLLASTICFSANANPLVKCSVKVLSSGCGSGTVELEVSKGDFKLHYGDIGCWFSDVAFEGEVKKVGEGVFTKTYELNALKVNNRFNLPKGSVFNIGVVELDLKAMVAKINVNSSKIGGARGDVYHLACE